MEASTRRRWKIAAIWALAAVVLLAVLVNVTARQLRTQVVAALGPRASLDEIALTWRGIELRGLRIAAAKGWPAADELRAERVAVMPDPRSLFGGPWRLARVSVDGGYVSMLRTRDGKLKLVPALLDRARAGQAGEAGGNAELQLVIAQVALNDGALEFYDATVASRPHKLRIEQLDATAGPIHLPALDRPIELAVAGRLTGPRRHGEIAIDGHFTPATLDARIDARFRGVDLVALQPYLVKASESGVKSGTLDLTLDATVQRKRLNAPGRVVLTGLELASGGGALATFGGVPRQAVIAALQRDGKIDVRFTLEGRVDDPNFSLNENFATRMASGMAEALGVSVVGVVEGVGGLVKGLLGR
ncbi:DUF748 domain-containing protein [Caldimonas sp. KR1-144]|uniref:DUF748 domain-containing protein n=1 Tax=Caldimonas sp. KR1-144 TaxID=3400911 RepID=UPI003C01F745